MVDDVDRKILRALQYAPRASFRQVGEVVGVSEQTVARRYHALRRDGVVRVVGMLNPVLHGEAEWVARIRCRPDRTGPLADSLARRPDIAFANLASGGSEIICVIHAPVEAARDDTLLRQLPRSSAVLDVTIHLLLHSFGTAGWTGYSAEFPASQARALRSDQPQVAGPLLPPNAEDTPLLHALADDGRATHTRLAEVTGWSKTRVAHRLAALETSGTLRYHVDLLPDGLGYPFDATLWLRVAPAHLARVGEELASHDEVAIAAATSGDHNLLVVAICRDTADFYRYLTTKVAAVPGIDAYGVSIRVRRLKQAASVISRGRLVGLTGAS